MVREAENWHLHPNSERRHKSSSSTQRMTLNYIQVPGIDRALYLGSRLPAIWYSGFTFCPPVTTSSISCQRGQIPSDRRLM